MRICLYGASSDKIDGRFMEEVFLFGKMLAEKGHSLVFGGGAQGLMGAAARGVTEKGGEILGVAPSFFKEVDGVLYEKCTEFLYTDTMRERKQLMEDNSDAFVVTPGGIGTFEEFFEILTLKQLGRHEKPVVIYNILGYYDTMRQLLDEAIEKEFMKPSCRELYAFLDTPQEVFAYLDSYKAGKVGTAYYKNI